MKDITLLFLCLLGFLFSEAQQGNLFIPSEIRKAYRAGARSPEGKPGPNYWQNHADYDIRVQVAPEKRQIQGRATIVYTNNSPNTLANLYLTLLYDVTRKGNVRDEPLPESLVTDGVQISALRINGRLVDLTDRSRARRYGTNLRIVLDDPLPPGKQLTAEIYWEEQLTADVGRVGYVADRTCFVGYWYPKVSVYDDIDGWDTNSWLGIAEFYSELSDFEVAITLPREYTVWATGVLQNAEAVLPAPVLERYRAAATAEETVTIIGEEDRKQGLTMLTDTWRFRADSVPDFAFAFSDDFLWDAASLPVANRRVRIHSVYPASRSDACAKATEWQRDIMRYFSENMPGIPYPYPEFTSFFKPYRDGGMEFPMMANNGSSNSENSMIGLIAHEMYHMYVPFYVRINEEKYAWMDEGWADFMDLRALKAMTGFESTLEQSVDRRFYLERTLGSQTNVPMITSTEYQTSDNYGYTSYTHPSFIYGLLEEALGAATFKACLQGYMERWAYKAPTPYDFFFSFDDISGQDLSWFWKPWFTEYGYPDLGIAAVAPGMVSVVKKGNKPISVQLTAVFAPGDTLRHNAGVAIWKDGQDQVTIELERRELPQRVFLNVRLPDGDKSDNYFLNDEAAAKQALDEYAGRYSLGNDAVARVTAGSGHLLFESYASGNSYLLLPVGEDRFGTPDGTFTITFLRNRKGAIVKYKGERLGNQFTWERLE